MQDAPRSDLPQPGYSIPTVARSLELPKSSVYRLVRKGILPAVKISEGSLRILAADLDRFLRERRTVPAA
jgi:excisionase family DNA binding protein